MPVFCIALVTFVGTWHRIVVAPQFRARRLSRCIDFLIVARARKASYKLPR